jgi:hypothetical protein
MRSFTCVPGFPFNSAVTRSSARCASADPGATGLEITFCPATLSMRLPRLISASAAPLPGATLEMVTSPFFSKMRDTPMPHVSAGEGSEEEGRRGEEEEEEEKKEEEGRRGEEEEEEELTFAAPPCFADFSAGNGSSPPLGGPPAADPDGCT